MSKAHTKIVEDTGISVNCAFLTCPQKLIRRAICGLNLHQSQQKRLLSPQCN